MKIIKNNTLTSNQYATDTGLILTLDGDFFIEICNCDYCNVNEHQSKISQVAMRAYAEDEEGNSYMLTVHDDRLNHCRDNDVCDDCDNFELDMIDYSTPELRRL